MGFDIKDDVPQILTVDLTIKTQKEQKEMTVLLNMTDMGLNENADFDMELSKDFIREVEKFFNTNGSLPDAEQLKRLVEQHDYGYHPNPDGNIEELAKKALINVIKEHCLKVGQIDDNNDDIRMHYIDTPDSHGSKDKYFIEKVAYDEMAEYDKFSGVEIWMKTKFKKPDNTIVYLPGVFIAEDLSFPIITEIVTILSQQTK